MPICLLSPLLAAAMAVSAVVPGNTRPLATAGSVEAPATGNAGTARTASPTFTFSTPGPKTVTLRACNSGGCSTVTKTLTVLDPAPRIGAVAGPTTVGTSEGPVTYSATVAGRPPLAYNWKLTLPDGSTDSASSPAFTWTPASVGDHRIDLTLSSLWGSQSSSLAVAVVPNVFADIPPSFFAASFVETLYFSGFTAGCSVDGSGRRLFCPANPVSRAELAVFLGRGLHPPPFVPPPATGLFADVPPDYWAGPWIEQAYRDGITSGCAAGSIRLFCPQSLATRAEIAVLFVRAVHGASFVPPAAVGIFGDVPAGYWAAPWIEQLYRDGISAGCQGGPAPLFCPAATTSRAEVAVFLVRAFHLVERPTPLAFAARLCASASACSYPSRMPIDFVLRLSGGIPASYDYDWNGDGSYEESAPFPRSHVYDVPGVYRPRLRLRLGSWSAVISHP
ncbi:MAG TPA: hypothetical protein VFR03_07065, partial [Thermoanaerobaculia bacterium]|nr:hypothetical protein [Thermoanaerobaculia bacterium]